MHNPGKQLSFEYNGGPLLSHVHLYLIYWGKPWKTKEGEHLMSQVTEAAWNMVHGGYLSGLAQYNQPAGQPFDVSCVATLVDAESDPPNPFTDSVKGGPSDVRDEIRSLIARKLLDPPADAASEALYMLILPHGVVCGTAAADGQPGDGQHFYFDDGGGNIYYGWVSSGTSGRPLERITVTLSEELVEAITDPIPGKGWVTPGTTEETEVCDVCDGVNLLVNGVLVKTYYSNQNQDCVAGKSAAVPLGKLAKPASMKG